MACVKIAVGIEAETQPGFDNSVQRAVIENSLSLESGNTAFEPRRAAGLNTPSASAAQPVESCSYEFNSKKSVKRTDTPDSVRRHLRAAVTAINLGRRSPVRLDATYPPA